MFGLSCRVDLTSPDLLSGSPLNTSNATLRFFSLIASIKSSSTIISCLEVLMSKAPSFMYLNIFLLNNPLVSGVAGR